MTFPGVVFDGVYGVITRVQCTARLSAGAPGSRSTLSLPDPLLAELARSFAPTPASRRWARPLLAGMLIAACAAAAVVAMTWPVIGG